MDAIQSAYTQWSISYDADRNLTRDLDAQITRTLLGPLYAERRADSIVELGCGTGKNTIFLAQLGNSVQAFDFSPGMLEQAKAKVDAGNVTFSQVDLTAPWPCADGAATLLVCNLVLEHIADLNFIFAQASRVLEPGGRFFISELHPFRQYVGKKAEFRQGDELLEIPAYTHHISEFFLAAVENGFVVEHLAEFWHDEDTGKPPRLVTFLFQNRPPSLP